ERNAAGIHLPHVPRHAHRRRPERDPSLGHRARPAQERPAGRLTRAAASMDTFSSITPAVRIHAGTGALERLPRELERLGVRRAFALCGRSVATRTPLLDRVAALAGARHAGAYTALGKDAPLDDVVAATEQARAAGADCLVAIGAGSVLKAGRVVAILLAESGSP